MNFVEAELLAVAFVFGANNMGVIRSAFRQASGRPAMAYLAMGAMAFSAGFFVEGFKVRFTFTQSLTAVGPSSSLAAITTTLLLMVALTLLRFPASLSNVVLGSMLGVSLASGAFVRVDVLSSILFAWVVAPLSAALVSLVMHRALIKLMSFMSLLGAAMVTRCLVIMSVAFISYSLGANNLGVLLGFLPGPSEAALALFATLMGGLLFSGRVAWLLGWRMATLSPLAYLSALMGASITLWAYTQLGIPTSLTQAIVGAMVFLSYMRKPSVVNPKVVYEVLGSWPILLAASLLISYFVGRSV